MVNERSEGPELEAMLYVIVCLHNSPRRDGRQPLEAGADSLELPQKLAVPSMLSLTFNPADVRSHVLHLRVHSFKRVFRRTSRKYRRKWATLRRSSLKHKEIYCTLSIET